MAEYKNTQPSIYLLKVKTAKWVPETSYFHLMFIEQSFVNERTYSRSFMVMVSVNS